MPATASQNLRAPLQERSRRTLDRVVDATERLLQDRSFEQISIQEILREAETSVGAFYARFRDKEALLPVLYARYDQEIGSRADERERNRPFAGRELSEIVRSFVGEFAGFYRERPNLMRALALYVRAHPERVDPQTRARRRQQHEHILEALLSCRAEIAHPDPERAVELALFFAVSACRERFLFAASTHAASLRIGEKEIVDEITRMVLGYLAYSGTVHDQRTRATSSRKK